jgi:hypothetical protein
MRSATIDTLYGAAGTSKDTALPATSRTSPKASIWTRFSDAVIAARMIQAKAIVARHLAHQTDDSLKALGWTDADIADLRRRIR